MRTTSLATALALLAISAPAATGQSVQYRSPAGVTYVSQPDTGGAVARAESVLAAEPRSVQRYIELGTAQSNIRRYREAIRTFTRGMEVEPENVLLYRWRGHRYLSVRELDSAKADLEKGFGLDSTNYGVLYHLGIVRFVNGDFGGAADMFRRARPLSPNDGERAGSIDWLWMSLSRAGRHDEATAMLARETDSLPAGNAYTQRIGLYRGELTPETAFTPADTADIQVATLSYGVGNWYLVKGDTARARQYFDRSVQSGGWPAFGFIAAEMELSRMK